MTTERQLVSPSGLAARGRAFWQQVTGEFDLDLAEVELLTEVARALDESEALHRVVEDQGRTVPGSRGQVVWRIRRFRSCVRPGSCSADCWPSWSCQTWTAIAPLVSGAGPWSARGG